MISGDPIHHGTAAYRRVAIALLMAGFSTFALLYDVQPLLPLFARHFGVGAATSSLAVSFTTAAMALAFIPSAVVSDRVGRRPVMVFSLFASSTLTLLSALIDDWNTMLLMRAAIGLALAGLPSVAMAYIAEEVHTSAVGTAMGLYVAGSAFGGMAGRLGIAIATQYLGWQHAILVMGTASLAAAFGFAVYAPPSRAFTPVQHSLRSLGAATGRLLCDPVLRMLYAEGFLLLGIFITTYNYLGFRLEAPPYSLSQGQVGAVFLLYLLGAFSSAWFSGLASRLTRHRVFWVPIALLALGIALTGARPLPVILLGLAVVTAAFFAAHATASGWVGQHAARDRAQATALYLLFYYLGSSVLGWAGGIAWNHLRWPGVVIFGVLMTCIALFLARRLRMREP